MKITVLGCGALGQLWMSALHQQGHLIQGWLRVPHPECDIKVTAIDGNRFSTTVEANNLTLLAQSELLLVTLKAWQIPVAVVALAAHLPAATPILLMHNGMGIYEELRTLPHPLLHAVTTQAARREGQQVVHVARGMTHLGPLTDSAAAFSELSVILHRSLPDVGWHNDIRHCAWNKLAVNCVINPLTALYGCLNGELVAYADEVTDVCSEVCTVMLREGLHTTRDYLIDYTFDVIRTTAANVSSMLQDVRAQRHTEIDYMTGYLLRRARGYGVDIPVNRRIYNLIKLKESHYERLSANLPGAWQ